jgi:DNA helicase-2/ATP-dependent DNA helicase PcrA
MPLRNLNQEQLSSATCKEGYNLIIASAGTGKTSTIVGRIGYLLNNSIKPEQILLLTFTNKAAIQMINRVALFFNKEIANSIMAGTFHSVSYKLLKQLNYDISLKQPSELKTLFKSIYEKRIFINKDENIPPYDGGYLYDIYSLFINSRYDDIFSDWLKNKNKAQAIYIDIYEDVIDEFNTLKNKYGYVNFDDLLLNMLKAQQINNFDFKEILVDEYQDTNPLQGKLLDGFKSKSLFCVGDYDQSIYAFNGSDIGIITSFDKRYKNSKIFTLTKNYRSTRPILNLASKVIKHNERVYEKKLEVVRTNYKHTPTLLAFDELYNQYEYIAQNIKKSLTKKDDIAVIYRNNSSADGIEINLRDLGIDYKRKGGHSFFDAKEIKAILDIITLIQNPNDMMAFIHIIQYGHGIGKAIAKDIFDALIKLGDGDILNGLFNPDETIKNPYKKDFIKNEQLGLFDNFMEMGSVARFSVLNIDERFLGNAILKHPKLSIEGAKYLFYFYSLMKELKRILKPISAIKHIQTSDLFIDILEYLSQKKAKQKDGIIDENIKKIANFKSVRRVETLKQLSLKYTNIKIFLNAMILGGGELSKGGGVNLLSIHASKGLEFTEVYVCDLMDGRFPNKTLIRKGGSLEEERRLFYVCVTRAKDILYLSYAKYDRIKRLDFIYSPFLKEAGLIREDKG